MDREKVRSFVESQRFQTFIIVIIVLNAIVIGIQTTKLSPEIASALQVFDIVCLVIYVVEAILKIYALHGAYFKDGWNVFDFIVVALSLIPAWLLPIPVQVARVVRLFRVARVFRLVSAFRQMRVIVEAIGRSIPGVLWTAVLLIIVMYVFAVAGVSLYGEEFPDYFGSLGAGLFTLFQFITLEGWPDIAREVMGTQPTAWLFFGPYIIISAFIIVNVVLGIIVNTIEESTQAERINQSDDADTQLATELAELRAQVRTVEYLLEKRTRAGMGPLEIGDEDSSEAAESDTQ